MNCQALLALVITHGISLPSSSLSFIHSLAFNEPAKTTTLVLKINILHIYIHIYYILRGSKFRQECKIPVLEATIL